jgi:predicted nuclease of predicted toxin-antitoxin system
VSRLFIELYLDEDVDVLVAALLKAHGFAAATAQEAGRKGEGDDEQLAYAVSRRRALLTHNRDHFARLAQEYFLTGREHCGIIIAVRRPPREIVVRLMTVLNQTTADELENQVIYI